MPKMTTEWKTVALYPIPSVIYLIHNNVQFATLTFVDTSTYQIMGNLKIVTTGILFRCIVLSSNEYLVHPPVTIITHPPEAGNTVSNRDFAKTTDCSFCNIVAAHRDS